MGQFRLISLVLMLSSAEVVLSADRITVAKNIPAPTGPWIVTPSINYAYPYGAWQVAPVTFNATDGFGFRAGDVLTIQYVSGLWCAGTYVSIGTCVDANGYRTHDPVNDTALNGSVYAPSKYIDPATYPVYLMQLVGTFADDRGQIVGSPFKVGNGPANVSIPAGATRLQLGSNMWSYYDARNYFDILNVSVSGAPPPVMNPVGAISHLVTGGPWKTTLVLLNSGPVSALARLNFFADDGRPLALTLAVPDSTDPVTASTIERTLAAGASLILESAGSTNETQGWAELVTDGNVTGFAVYGLAIDGRTQEVAVPLETRSAGTYVVCFDHTGALASGLGLANVSTATVTASVTIRDEHGTVISTDSLVLPPRGHAAHVSFERWPETSQRRGTIEVRTPGAGQISLLGLRFNNYAFSALPVIAK